MEKKQILLPSKAYAQASEKDLQTKIGFEVTDELLREGDKTIILDIARLFDKERNESLKYTLYGKIKMVFRNMYSGETYYDNLLEKIYLRGDGSTGDLNGYIPYDEFAFLRRDIYREITNASDISPTTQGTYTPNIVANDKPNLHQDISLMDAPYHNWNLYLSYVYDQDTTYQIKYSLSGNTTPLSFVSGDGIPCRVVDEGKTYKLTTPVPHGISINEYVVINGKTYTINRLGDETFNSDDYVLTLDKAQFSGASLNSLVTIKRCLDKNNVTGSTCNYYVHKHKTLSNVGDYILDKAGFESPIFEDEKKLLFENSAGVNNVLVERNRMESVLYNFRDPFVLSGITNNMGYTPTEVYVSVLFKNASGYFDYPPKIGYKFNLHDTWVDKQFDATNKTLPPFVSSIPTTTFFRTQDSTTFTFTGGTEVPKGTVLIGALVEYDPINKKERIVSEALHKFNSRIDIFDHKQNNPTANSYYGLSNSNMLGYFYQPHHRVKLRQLSPYMETSNTNNILDLPDNASYNTKTKLWEWHDVYDHGYIDDEGNGTDFPFVNGQHYVKTDFNFYLRNEKEYLNKQDGLKKFGKTKC
jgi:hypothetical protein